MRNNESVIIENDTVDFPAPAGLEMINTVFADRLFMAATSL
jgi:hypothetical protein